MWQKKQVQLPDSRIADGVVLIDPVTGLAQHPGGNITGKIREAFESYSPNTPDSNWLETKAAGDLVYLDGNAAAASYLVISKDPLTAGTETAINSTFEFNLPIDFSIGLSMSQRTLGQEFSVEVVDTGTQLPTVDDIAISSISQATTTLTIDTVASHNLSVGQSVGIYGCSNLLGNFPALVVASVPSPTQFTATAGPGGTITSQTITNPAGAKGFVYFRERLGRANNGLSQIFENTSATSASLYIRSESGDAMPSGTVAGNHSVTVGTTVPVALVNSANQYAWTPTTEYRFFVQADRTQWVDSAVDSVAQQTNRLLRTQVCPDPSSTYKLRIRAVNNKSLTVPIGQIVSAVKTGTATATITTDVPHGLAVANQVVIYGIRDQAAASFPNLLTSTAVASVVNDTTFTIVIGTASTVTSYGGYVAKVQGGNLMSSLGAIAQAVQEAVLTTMLDGTRQLTLTGSANWSGLSIGDLVNVIGCRNIVDGATLSVDGAWKVANTSTTTLTLVLPYSGSMTLPADFTATSAGGGVIKRTDFRISFIRVFDYERQRVEMLTRPASDLSASVPVVVQNSPASYSVAGTNGNNTNTVPNPVLTSVIGVSANPATGTTARQQQAIGTLIGVQITKPYAIPEAGWNSSLALTTTTAAAIMAAGGAGLKRHMTALQAINTGASAVELIILDGTTERWRLTLPVNVPVAFEFPTEITTTANTALNANLSAAGTVRANFQGYTAP